MAEISGSNPTATEGDGTAKKGMAGWTASVRRGWPAAGLGGLFKGEPSFRFGVHLGERMRAADCLKGGRTIAAAAIRTPVNLPALDQFAAVVRMSQDGQATESRAFAKAGYRAAS